MMKWNLTTTKLKNDGVSGEDKSPFSGKRSNPYPNPPLEKTTILKKFGEAAKNLDIIHVWFLLQTHLKLIQIPINKFRSMSILCFL